MSVLDILIAIAVVAYVIGRQVMGEPLRGRRLIVLPAVLAIIGIVELSQSKGQHFGPADGLCLAISGVAAAAIGVAQGASMRLESRNGYLWGRMPLKALWWWAALLASRGAVTLLAIGMHAHVAESTASILLTLGINRLAQAAVVAPRALSAGVPFAPEKNGKVLFGDRFAQAANPQSQYGRSSYGRNQYGQPGYGQPGYGQPRSSQPQGRWEGEEPQDDESYSVPGSYSGPGSYQQGGSYRQGGSYQAGGPWGQGNGPVPADRPLAPTDLRSLLDMIRSQATRSGSGSGYDQTGR
jgi:hypothetical protein